MATIPVFNPILPFLGEIPGGLFIGKGLLIRGQVTEEAMFNINLLAGAAVNPRDDTPLHISIRPSDKKIVRNNFLNGEWQNEERDGRCPIAKNSTFELQIKVKESHYTIKIDGKKFCKFKHRAPVASVRFVQIEEGGVIESITESV